jgi:hypothetical protein
LQWSFSNSIFWSQKRSFSLLPGDQGIDPTATDPDQRVDHYSENWIRRETAPEIGQPGEVISYVYVEQKRIHPKSRKLLSSIAVESPTGEYRVDWYLNRLDHQVQEMTGIQTIEGSQLSIDLV